MLNATQTLRLDAAGAALSSLLLGAVLPSLHDRLGLSPGVFRALALGAGVFLLYDLLALRAPRDVHPRRLLGILLANLAYCGVTSSLLLVHWGTITPLCAGYFLLELLVLVALIAFEWRVYKASSGGGGSG